MTRRAEASKGQHDSAPARPRSAGETPAIRLGNPAGDIVGKHGGKPICDFTHVNPHHGDRNADHSRGVRCRPVVVLATGFYSPDDIVHGVFDRRPVVHFRILPIPVARHLSCRTRRRDCESPSLMGPPVFVENKDGPGAFPYGGKITAPDAKLPAGERDEQS